MPNYDSPIQLGADELSRMEGLLKEDLSMSRAGLSVYHSNLDVYRQYMLDQWPGDTPMFSGASMIHVPYVKRCVHVLMAEIAPSLLNILPMLHWEDPDPMWRPAADALEDFYQDLLIADSDSPFKADFRRVLYRGMIDGVCPVRMTYDIEPSLQWAHEETVTQTVDPLTGQVLEQQVDRKPVRVEGVDWEGPRVHVIDVKRFGTLPTTNASVRYSSGVWTTYDVTLHTLWRDAQRGLYDKERVLKLLDILPGNANSGSPQDVQQQVSAANPNADNKRDAERQELEITEVIYRYSPKDGTPLSDWLFVIEESTGMLLTARPFPYWLRNGRRNVLTYTPFLGTGEIYGDSLASAGAGHIQEAKTNLLRLAINEMERRLNSRKAVPKSLYSELKSSDSDEDYSGLGALVPYPDAFFQQGGDPSKMLIDGISSPIEALPLLQYVDLEGDRITSVNDTNRNAVTPNETATANLSRQQAAQLLSGMIKEHAAEALQDIAEIAHDLIRQYQDRPAIQQRWEKIAAKHPGLPPLAAILERPMRVEPNGITRTINEQIEADRAMKVFQIASQEKRVMENERRRWNLETKTAQKVAKERNPEDIFGTADEWEQEKAQEEQQQIAMVGMAMQQQQAQQAQQMQMQREGQQQKGAMDLLKLAATAGRQ